MLLTTLDLSFHATTSLGPLTNVGSHLFIVTLISELFVLVLEPKLLQLLLFQVIGREVRKVVGDALELVNRCVLHIDAGISVERFECRFELCAFSLNKRPSSIAKFD